METKIFLDRGIIDISHIKLSVQENNSKVSDQQFSKYMFPLEMKMTPELITILGDYISYESNGLENKINCKLLFENKLHDAILYIQSSEGYTLTLQLDFGFEDLPNSEKKLSELPLEKFEVSDIHTYAKSICEKKWPFTNFNFPRIYTTKYSPDDEVWKNFDGYINDLKPDGSEMRKNYIEADGTIRNVNIIHPCPHPLYILKTGFSDAGLELAGDILEDNNLLNRWVYSGTEYFSRLTQRRLGLSVMEMDYDSWNNFMGATYIKNLVVEKGGVYKLKGFFSSRKYKGSNIGYILLNGVRIWSFNSSSYDTQQFFFDFSINIPADSNVTFYLLRMSDKYGSDVVISADIIGDQLDEEVGEDNGVITNKNEIDLSRAVPAMTFGEYVNVFRNWFNYDVEIIGNQVFMNKIGKSEITNVKDFTEFEVVAPLRNFLNKKSFLLRFPELDSGKKDNMFYDSTGPKINGKENTETTIIDIKGYAMPLILPKPGGYLTANVLKDSDDLVALVQYTGLLGNQNNATYSPGCDFPELFASDWEKWLRQRINGQEFIWKKKVNIEKYSQYKIKDYIFAYNNVHIIKSLTKDKISESTYENEFTTETVV